jgi:hypothetical protein
MAASTDLYATAGRRRACRRATTLPDTRGMLASRGEWIEIPTTTFDGQPTVVRVQQWYRDLVYNDAGRPVLVPVGDQIGMLPIALWLDRVTAVTHT